MEPVEDIIVIGTKLMPPKLKANTIERRALIEQMVKSRDKRLILVYADAGYGKTTLLTQFCDRLASPFIYYSVEPSDADLTIFFRYLIDGLRSLPHGQGFGRKLSTILDQTRNIEMICGIFINEFLDHFKSDVHVILDDFHYLQSNSGISCVLDFLLSHQPANLHLLIASRAKLAIDINHYVVKNEILIIDKEQLRFQTQEFEKLIRSSGDVTLSAGEIARILQCTDGWITAIQLLMPGLARSDISDVDRMIRRHIATRGDLFNYFTRETYQNLSDEIKEFLLQTSFLNWLDPGACNAVARLKNSDEMLERLAGENSFLVKRENIYQYHVIFRDFLLHLAGRHYSIAEQRRINHRIADYFQRQKKIIDATDYYITAREFRPAVISMKKVADDLMSKCRFHKLLTWIEVLPGHVIESDPELLKIAGDVCWQLSRVEEAYGYYSKSAALARRKAKKKKKIVFSSSFGMARIDASAGRFEKVLENLKRIKRIANLKPDDLAEVLNLEGVSYIYRHEFERAERIFQRAHVMLRTKGRNHFNVSLMNNLAIVVFTRGELDKAVNMFRDILRKQRNVIAEPHLHMNIALALIDLGRIEEARDALVSAWRAMRLYYNIHAFLPFLMTLGFYHLEKGNTKKAEHYFSRQISLSTAVNDQLSLMKARHGLMKSYFLEHRISEARAIAKEMLGSAREAGIRNHDVHLIAGLVEMQAGNMKSSERIFLRALKVVENTGFKYSLMKNYYYLAYLYITLENAGKARDMVEKALGIARRHGYDFFLVRSARLTTAPLKFALEQNIERPYATRVQDSLRMRSKIAVNFFGPFMIKVDGEPITGQKWTTKKARVIFAYLIRNRTRAVTKEELMEKFSNPNDARRADQDIRTTISRIQKALPWKILDYSRGCYYMDKRVKVELDAEIFERLVKGFIDRSIKVDDANCHVLESAVNMYGEGFMPGFYDHWSESERLYFTDQYIQVLEMLADHFFNSRNHEKARELYKKIIMADVLHENANAGYLRTLVRMKREHEARQHLLVYERKFKEEFGADLNADIKNILKNP